RSNLSRPSEVVAGDDHGNQKETIRSSVGPQHVDEPCAPCPRAGRTDALAGASTATRTPQERDRHRLLSPTGDQGNPASGPASCGGRVACGWGPTGRACTRPETETECPCRTRRAWEAGTPARSGGERSRGGCCPAAA